MGPGILRYTISEAITIPLSGYIGFWCRANWSGRLNEISITLFFDLEIVPVRINAYVKFLTIDYFLIEAVQIIFYELLQYGLDSLCLPVIAMFFNNSQPNVVQFFFK